MKLPRCAACGKPLAHQARILVVYRNLPGHPEVGWHLEDARCAAVGKELQQIGERSGEVLELVLRLYRSHPDRVFAGAGWRRLLARLPAAGSSGPEVATGGAS